MTLGSDITAALPGLRAQAESRMRDTVTVGETKDDTDPATGDPVKTFVTIRYDRKKGRIRYGSGAGSSEADQISQPVVVQTPYLSIPWGSPRLYEGDTVVVDASEDDPLLVGRTYTIAGNAPAGQVTAYRYPLTETT